MMLIRGQLHQLLAELSLLSVPAFLGLPQEIQSRNDDYVGCSLRQERQAPLLLTLTLLANAMVPTVAVCNLTDKQMMLLTRTHCR